VWGGILPAGPPYGGPVSFWFRTTKKGRAPLEALPFTATSADLYFNAQAFEALPFGVPSNLTVGTGDAPIDEVSECNYRQCRSYHRAPSFQLASDIDSHVTAQTRVFVFTLKVGFTGINMSFVSVVGVILSSIFGHGVTSLFASWLV